MYRTINVRRKRDDIKTFFSDDTFIKVHSSVSMEDYRELHCKRVKKYEVGDECKGCPYFKERFRIAEIYPDGMALVSKVRESCLISEAEAKLGKRKSASEKEIPIGIEGIYMEEHEKHGQGFVMI